MDREWTNERTSDNTWRNAGKVEKKKKNRNYRRSNDCSNVGLNGLLMEFSSDSIELDGARRLSVPIPDAPLFSQIFIFATLPRFLADNTDATPPLCSARTRKQLRRLKKPRDGGITIRDFHSLRAFCSSLLSNNNLTNAFWATRWKRLHCCWFKKKNTFSRFSSRLKVAIFQKKII